MKPLIKVYSHPRSGTHLTETFLARNFYPDEDLFEEKVTWGHWSNRLVKSEGTEYGKLFGGHILPPKIKMKGPSVYVYRDFKGVAYSCWKTPNFKHDDIKDIRFSEYLRTPIDWYGSPSIKEKSPRQTIVEHWYEHVRMWKRIKDPNLLLVRYEDIVNNPEKVIEALLEKFDFLQRPMKIDPIRKLVGLLPNAGNETDLKKIYTIPDRLFTNYVYFKSFLKHHKPKLFISI